MKLLAFVLTALLLYSGISMAFMVKPAYQGTQDTGNVNLPALDVGITIDCDSKEMHVSVASNETGEAVEGATAYLFYTDYSYQALPNPGKTDAAGDAKIPVPGTLRFLNALFILRVDKQGFQSREIQFTYKKCFETQPEPAANNSNGSSGQANQTPPANTTPQQNATSPSNGTPPANTTAPTQPGGNDTGTPQPDGQGAGASACPAAAGLALLSLFIAKARG